jgi:hypothetical protein
MHQLSVPTGKLVVCVHYKWVGVSKDIGSSWSTNDAMMKDVNSLLNDPQFKKSEFFGLLQSAVL